MGKAGGGRGMVGKRNTGGVIKGEHDCCWDCPY